MGTTRMTGFMKRSLEARLSGLNARIDSLEDRRQGDDDETAALLGELMRERDDIVDALRDARLIDDDPFDSEAIEIGDVVTLSRRGRRGRTIRPGRREGRGSGAERLGLGRLAAGCRHPRPQRR